MKANTTFSAKITQDKNSGWTCVVWPESVSVLGTGRPVKVTATVGDHEFQATFLPIGNMHMLPIRATVLKAIGKQVGDIVVVRILV